MRNSDKVNLLPFSYTDDQLRAVAGTLVCRRTPQRLAVSGTPPVPAHSHGANRKESMTYRGGRPGRRRLLVTNGYDFASGGHHGYRGHHPAWVGRELFLGRASSGTLGRQSRAIF